MAGENYSAYFTSSAEDPTGDYSIRVRVTDQGGGRSDWILFPDLITVLNNEPRPYEGRIKPLKFYEDKAEWFDLSEFAHDAEDDSTELRWEIYLESSPLFQASMISPSTRAPMP